VGAAPGGWIAVRSAAAGAGAHVLRYSTSGAATDLGAPMAGSSLFSVAPGPKGVVAYSRNGDDTTGTGLIRYMPYSTPGRWRTLLAAGPGRSTFCGRPTGTAVVCEARTSKHSGQVLLSLTSSRRVWVDDHRTVCQTNAFVAVGSTAVARESTTSRTCRNRRLTQISMTGRVTYSKALSGEHGASITDGLGGILLMSADQRRIVSISDVRAKPRTVVTAH
jgi:hypothetical protein